MPLLKDKNIGQDSRLALWQMSEDIEELYTLLDCSPKPVFPGTNEQRKKQHVCARILLKFLTQSNCSEISYNEFNKPFLVNSDSGISISHSGTLVGVIHCNTGETGLDIERIKPQIHRIASRFLSENEMTQIPKPIQTEQLTVYWCAKEALYKYYGKKEIRFKEDLYVEPFPLSSDHGNITGYIISPHFNIRLSLSFEKMGEYMLVYVNEKIKDKR